MKIDLDRIPNIMPGREVQNWCGPACISTALARLGLPTSQTNLASRLDHQEDYGDILASESIQLGAKAIWVQGVPLDHLSQLVSANHCQVVVCWMSDVDDDSNHFSLLELVTPEYIVLNDPDLCGMIKILRRSDFINRWWAPDSAEENGRSPHWSLVLQNP